MTKQLLIENGFITDLKISSELKESISVAQGKGDTLIVRNVPCTILNRKNQNDRIYSTKEVQKAINNAAEQIRTKQLLSQACEHPEGSFVSPTTASHVITKAYIKPNVEVVVEGKKGRFDMLFMDWEVLDTEEGKNLKALIKAECSLGTSIRGLGDMNGDQVVDYELLGVDVVSNPSSGTFTRMPVKESVIVESKKQELEEAYTVSGETIDTVANTQIASELLSKLDSDEGVGSLSKASVKFDTEVDPDTGAETTVTILTTDTTDDVDDLSKALELAGRKMASTVGTTDSVTITRVEDEEIVNNPKESVELKEEDKIDLSPLKINDKVDELYITDLANAQTGLVQLGLSNSLEDLNKLNFIGIVNYDDFINFAYDKNIDHNKIHFYECMPFDTESDLFDAEAVREESIEDKNIKVDNNDVTLTPKNNSNQSVTYHFDNEDSKNTALNMMGLDSEGKEIQTETLDDNVDLSVVTDGVEAKDEKLYTNPDAPSDEEVLNDSKDSKDFKTVLTDLDFDLDFNLEDLSDEELQEIYDNLPDEILVDTEYPLKSATVKTTKEEGFEPDPDYDPMSNLSDNNDKPEIDSVTITILPEDVLEFTKTFKSEGLNIKYISDNKYIVTGDSDKLQIIKDLFGDNRITEDSDDKQLSMDIPSYTNLDEAPKYLDPDPEHNDEAVFAYDPYFHMLYAVTFSDDLKVERILKYWRVKAEDFEKHRDEILRRCSRDAEYEKQIREILNNRFFSDFEKNPED